MNTENEGRLVRRAERGAAGFDPVTMAANAAHVAAAELAETLGPKDDPTFEPNHWPSLGGIVVYRGDDTSETAVLELADHIADRVRRGQNVPAESLFRQAKKRKMHDTDGAEWRGLPAHEKLPFEIFASVCSLTYERLDAMARAEKDRAAREARIPPKPVAIGDTIFEEQEPMGAMDPDRVEAIRKQAAAAKKAKATARKKKPAAANDEGGDADTVMGPESAEAADNKPLSVGEKPPKVTGPAKRGGARKPAAKKGGGKK